MSLFSFFRKKKTRTAEEYDLGRIISKITGFKPSNISLYHLAMIHSSMSQDNCNGAKESNERLEFLGDAILGSIIAEYLFKKYPLKDEGFLTELRSKIVNRESLNNVGYKLGLNKIIRYNQGRNINPSKSLYGNALEALVGAIYLDKGYRACKKFILQKLLIPYYDIDELCKTKHNYKSMIIEWSQKEGKSISFATHDDTYGFISTIFIDEKAQGTGKGTNKKKAEQEAAHNSCILLNLG